MKTLQVDILEPKAIKLLRELANLKLIQFQEVTDSKKEFKKLVNKIRSRGGDELSTEEIIAEIDVVRAKNHKNEDYN